MQPIDQTKFEAGRGNCFQAVLASIFEIPIESIPYFQDEDDWFATCEKWMLECFGLQPVILNIVEDWNPIGYHEISGFSPRGNFKHSVVGRDGGIVHDPHPSREGLKTIDSIMVFLKVIK